MIISTPTPILQLFTDPNNDLGIDCFSKIMFWSLILKDSDGDYKNSVDVYTPATRPAISERTYYPGAQKPGEFRHRSESPAQTAQRETEQRQDQAVQSMNEDSFAQSLKENFNAEIVPGSVKPVV